MTVEDIPNLVRDKLNETGKKYELVFQVSQQVLSEGGWLKLFIASNVEDKNRIIANQIISDVEEECTVASEHELLLIPVPEIEDPV